MKKGDVFFLSNRDTIQDTIQRMRLFVLYRVEKSAIYKKRLDEVIKK